MNPYKDAEESFLQMIDNLSSDLADYSTKDGANPRYIKRQESLIKTMRYFREQCLERISEFNTDCNAIHKSLIEYELIIAKFTLICQLHGIDNIRSLIQRNIFELQREFNQAKSENWRQMPMAFLDYKVPQT